MIRQEGSPQAHPVPDVLPLFSLREQRRTKTRLNDPQTATNSKNTPKVKQGDKVKSSDVFLVLF